MKNRDRYLVPLLAAGVGLLAGHLAASAAVAMTWLEVQTRSEAVARRLQGMERTVAEIAARTPEPPPEAHTQPAVPMRQAKVLPMKIQSSRVGLVYRDTTNGRFHFGWEVRVANPNETPLRRSEAMFYLAGPKGEPRHALGMFAIDLPPGCSQLLRGETDVRYTDLQEYARVMIADAENAGEIEEQIRKSTDRKRGF